MGLSLEGFPKKHLCRVTVDKRLGVHGEIRKAQLALTRCNFHDHPSINVEAIFGICMTVGFDEFRDLLG